MVVNVYDLVKFLVRHIIFCQCNTISCHCYHVNDYCVIVYPQVRQSGTYTRNEWSR